MTRSRRGQAVSPVAASGAPMACSTPPVYPLGGTPACPNTVPAGNAWWVWVPGQPVPWQRTRPAVRPSGKMLFHTPTGDAAWRDTLRAAWVHKHGYLGLTCPVRLTVVAIGSRGDWDNLAKSVGDALQQTRQEAKLKQPGPAWNNDAAIVDGRCIKLPVRSPDRPPGMWILVERAQPEEYGP